LKAQKAGAILFDSHSGLSKSTCGKKIPSIDVTIGLKQAYKARKREEWFR
jgi:hypothetical protein